MDQKDQIKPPRISSFPCVVINFLPCDLIPFVEKQDCYRRHLQWSWWHRPRSCNQNQINNATQMGLFKAKFCLLPTCRCPSCSHWRSSPPCQPPTGLCKDQPVILTIDIYLGQFSDPIWKPTSSFGTVTLHWTVRSSPRPGTAREGLEGRQESSELEVDCLADVVDVVERRRRNTWLAGFFIIWADPASVGFISRALIRVPTTLSWATAL